MPGFRADLLSRYQVRRGRVRKDAFLRYARQACEEMGYSCQIETHKGLFSSRNLVVGDVENARVVFTAHYDTCAEMPVPNLIFPHNMPLTFLVQMPLVILMLALGIGAGALLLHWTGSPAAYRIGFLAVYFALFALLFFGPANRHTANDNTSGVLALLRIMAALPEEKRGQTAFLFFDNEEYGKVGSKQYAKAHPGLMDGKVLLNLDCIGDGDSFLIVAPKKAPEALEALLRHAFRDEKGKQAVHCSAKNTHYNSDQMSFKNGAAVAACRKNRLGYFVPRIHTRRDTICEESNIDYAVSGALRLVDSL